MAKKKAKKKAKPAAKAKQKSKAKAKPKVKSKAKAKPKAKPKAKAKSKTKATAKPKPKPRPNPNPGPVTVYPNVCDPFTASTGDTVAYQNIPANGCEIEQDGIWPFNVGPPIFLPSPSTIMIAVGKGSYTIEVKCCGGQMPKVVTVP